MSAIVFPLLLQFALFYVFHHLKCCIFTGQNQAERKTESSIHKSVFSSSSIIKPSKDLPLGWEQHSKLLPGVNRGTDISSWSVEDVCHFVRNLPGCLDYVRTFKEEVIILYKSQFFIH